MRLCVAICFLVSLAYAQRLAPGDKIRLICEQEPTLSVDRVLSPQGEIVLPLLGRISLAGKYVVEAEDELQRLAVGKIGGDRILIAITLLSDNSSPIEFAGAVKRSGSLPFHPGLTLDEIVKLAEPSSAAAIEAVEITEANGRIVIVDLNQSGSATKLRPGDRVFFPRAQETNDVIVLGGVSRPGSKSFKADLTIRSAIDLAGGISGHGDGSKVRIERKGKAPLTIDVASPEGNQKVQRGDVIFVPMSADRHFVTILGLVAKPGRVEFRPGLTLTAAIKASGGLLAFAGSDLVTVKRLGSWKRRFDLTKISAHLESDLELSADDMIEVPMGRWKKVGEATKEAPKDKPRYHPVVPPR